MAECNSSAGAGRNCPTFPNAADARSRSLCPSTIWSEICNIQQSILTAIDNCQLSLVISDGTAITSINAIAEVTVNSGGVDYDTVSATATVTHPVGTGADIVPVVTNGTITDFTINSGGTGYQPIEASADASTTGDGNAVFQVVVDDDGAIDVVYVLSGGTGYSPGDAITIVHPTGSGANVTVATIGSGGRIISTVVNDGGSGYEAVEAEISIVHPSGFGFSGTVLQNSGTITGVSISNGGSGYADLEPEITITSDSGTGATFDIITDGSGTITSVDVLSGGAGYTSSDTISVTAVPGTGGTGADLSLTVTTVDSNIDPVLYYNVWNNLEDGELQKSQLNFIVEYFTCLGYNIQLQTNTETGNTLQWSIRW